MKKVIFLLIVQMLFLITACGKKENLLYKDIESAKKDGFEVVLISNNNTIKVVKFSDIAQNKENNSTFLLPLNRVDEIAKEIQSKQNSNNMFVTLDAKPINKNSQNICLGYHYSKSAYHYCYQANKNSIIPKSSQLNTITQNKKIVYKNN